MARIKESRSWTDCAVRDLMTPVSELFVLSPDMAVERADEVARERGIRHAFVTDRDQPCGLVCRCDLVAPRALGCRVKDVMSTRFWSVPAEAAIQRAAVQMARHRVGCLPVVSDGQLVGIITRGDLRRAGVEEDMLGATRCAACGDVHGVLPLWDGSDVEFCLSCVEVAREQVDYVEMGAGD